MLTAEQKTGTLETLLIGTANLLMPLKQDLSDGKARVLLAQLGLQLPATADAVSQFSSSVEQIVTEVTRMPQLIGDLISNIETDNYGGIIQVGENLLRSIIDTTKGVDDMSTAIKGMSAATGLPQSILDDFADQLPRKLIDYLVVRNVEYVPIVPEILEFLGVIERNLRNSGSTDPALPEFTEYGLLIDNLTGLVASPLDQFQTLYDWGAPGFDGTKLLPVLQSLLGKAGIPAITDDTVSPPVLDIIFLEISAETDVDPKGLLVKAVQNINIDRAIPFNEGGDWTIEAITNSDLEAETSLLIQPDGRFTFTPPTAYATGEYGIRFTAENADNAPYIIFGKADGSRLQVSKFVFETTAGLKFDSGSTSAEGSLIIRGQISGGKLHLDFSGSDGFLSVILSGVKVDSDFEIEFGFSSSDGLFFIGSSTLDIQLPLHLNLGPIDLDALTLSLGVSGTEFPIGISANIKAALGPLAVVVEEIGVVANLSIPDDRKGGNLGPLDFDLGLKPPKGLGASLDAGVVKGGGYLYFDPDREEYAGALELVFSEWLALKAIGLITTKMPDGSQGFSLLIIITVEFGSGIQLGLGFTLLGVGGLLGLHRIVNIDSVKEGIRTGAIESVMFPKDVIANAPKIISDLKKFFPVQLDIFLIGPLAKLGWGTPPLVTAQVGVILEFPNVNITLLGVVKVALPDEDADILRLQVNFVGRLEPSNKLLWFYAELYDSRVLTITLEGGFGLLVKWGDDANFVFSAGGFHPRYDPPPLPFPEPPRIAASILNESYARIRIEGYFAVTSNSAQFGARAELYFGMSDFGIEGYLTFDALFQFDPFYFSFSLSVSLSVKVFGIGLFSVGFSGMLEGPTPWHIKGKGKIKLLFFSIKVPFEHTWGPSQDTKLEPIEVFPLLEKEFNALTNWEARLPESSNLLVSLRQLGESDSDQLVLHPVGRLRVSQRKVPVNFKLDKVGNQRPADVNEIDVEAALPGANVTVTVVREKFAIGQFKDLDSSNQLSSPAFEPLEGGIEIAVAGEEMKTSQAVRRVIRYETIIIDNNFKEHTRNFFEYFTTAFALVNTFLFTHFLKGSAAKKSVLSQHHKKRLQPYDQVIQIQPSGYSIVTNTDNRPFDGLATAFTSQAQAKAQMEQLISSDPALAGRLHVIPDTEINTSL